MVAEDPVIQFEGVALAFGANQVLRTISFTLHRGETLVLLGVTGTGKTLILKLALGLLRPDAGRIRVLGREITQLEEEDLFPIRAQLGMVFQEMALFDSLTVYENVAYRLIEETVHGQAKLSEEETEQRVREVLRFVELEEAIWKLPDELSGGMKRRVGLARALITEPLVLLYDSPTAGLDPVTAQTILTLIIKLRDTRQASSLYVTHRLQDAFILANHLYEPASGRLKPVGGDGFHPERSAEAAQKTRTRFLLLRDGAIYFEGSPAELLAAADPYVQRYLA
jgi:phospholipid/cholesterol/gamma-HCH transport system ATP-binding protein